MTLRIGPAYGSFSASLRPARMPLYFRSSSGAFMFLGSHFPETHSSRQRYAWETVSTTTQVDERKLYNNMTKSDHLNGERWPELGGGHVAQRVWVFEKKDRDYFQTTTVVPSSRIALHVIIKYQWILTVDSKRTYIYVNFTIGESHIWGTTIIVQ